MKRFPKENQEKVVEIVDFYMQYVTDEHYMIREMLEYAWNCMSKWTIDDYLETVRERKKNEQVR